MQKACNIYIKYTQSLNRKGYKIPAEFWNPVFPNTTSRRRWTPIARCADPYYVDCSEYQPMGSHPKGSHETVKGI